MTSSIRLGRVAGIEVGVNWSVLAIFALVALSLSAGRFPLLYPGRSAAAYWTAGLVAAVTFFASLFAHEISHALMAQRHGIEVEGITLWLFGGVARLKGEADTPAAELRVAGIGPLVSLLLGAFFLGVALLLSSLGVEGLPFGTVAWLGGINVVLALFNLVPAAPLDGGRLLRAYLWKRRGDRTSAAVTAAKAGQTFGYVLIALGLWQFLGGAGIGGLWLVLIGWFLVNAATMEERNAAITGELAGVRVADVMSPDPATVPGSLSVQRFIDEVLLRERHSAYPVAGATGPTGLVTLQRVRDVPPERRGELSLGEVAAPLDQVVRVSPDDELVDVLPRLLGGADGRALVLDDGRLVGILTRTDVTRAIDRAALRRP